MRFAPKVKVLLLAMDDTVLDEFLVRSENGEIPVSHKVKELIGRYYDVDDGDDEPEAA